MKDEFQGEHVQGLTIQFLQRRRSPPPEFCSPRFSRNVRLLCITDHIKLFPARFWEQSCGVLKSASSVPS